MIAAGGLVLWFSRRRTQRKMRGTSGRRRTLGLHGTVGVWAALGFFFLVGDRTDLVDVRRREHRRTAHLAPPGHPAVSAAAGGEHSGHGGPPRPRDDVEHGVGLDKVLAPRAAEGLGDPVEIVPPADASSGVRRAGRSSAAGPPSRTRSRSTRRPARSPTTVRFADYPMLAKLTRWGIDAHTGVLFGIVNQLVLMALALA